MPTPVAVRKFPNDRVIATTNPPSSDVRASDASPAPSDSAPPPDMDGDAAADPVDPDRASRMSADGVDAATAMPSERAQSSTDAPTSPAPSARGRRPAPPSSAPPRPTNVRPRGLPRADKPGEVPEPDHHHLPGWVRRSHAQARPVLADLLGLLAGPRREQFATQVRLSNDAISSGKFSVAWQYPQLIAEGQTLFEQQSRENQVRDAARAALDAARRTTTAQLRNAEGLAPDVSARLTRALKGAADVDSIRAVEVELRERVIVSRTSAEKRRDRQIERERGRLNRSRPGAPDAAAADETWQDVLRRLTNQPDD